MPVSWTAEADRTLLLKLIETHGISINAQKIADAWPNGTSKPTARAITERFVKIRHLAGLTPERTAKAKLSKAPPASGRAKLSTSTPKSTPKKRKVKNDYESDGEDHLTAESADDTPTKSRKTNGASNGTARRGVKTNFKGSGNVLGDFEDSPHPYFVKKEPAEDPFIDFAEQKARAEQLRDFMNNGAPQINASSDSAYSSFGYGMPIPGNKLDSGFDGGNDTFHPLTNATAASMANGNIAGYQASGYSLQDINGGMAMGDVNGYTSSPMRGMAGIPSNDNLVGHTRRLGLSPASSTTNSVRLATPAPARERTPRKAGAAARQNVSTYVQNEKKLDHEMGEASSVEDSAESQFEDDDDGVV